MRTPRRRLLRRLPHRRDERAHQGLRPGEDQLAAPAGGVPSRAVDQFFAPAAPASRRSKYEHRSPTPPYRAVYSAVLLEGAPGRFRDAVEEVVPGEGEPYHAVFPGRSPTRSPRGFRRDSPRPGCR
ncbi:MAG: hypothetical protein IPJ61_21065 [Tessaracoccus sp.]|uniref:hypothetical protein n=1 Tax=Tessaracoccus sp. TaxID=1971211 RepID=UPI001EB89E13|nr:hypothetical protein [Tessaracoccus sp.]MBK7823481.1 hypothetical protein [Tessaracoccus sp.]